MRTLCLALEARADFTFQILEVRSLTIAILQMRKLMLGEVKELAGVTQLRRGIAGPQTHVCLVPNLASMLHRVQSRVNCICVSHLVAPNS